MKIITSKTSAPGAATLPIVHRLLRFLPETERTPLETQIAKDEALAGVQ